jgi:hypothetical protein
VAVDIIVEALPFCKLDDVQKARLYAWASRVLQINSGFLPALLRDYPYNTVAVSCMPRCSYAIPKRNGRLFSMAILNVENAFDIWKATSHHT